MRLVKTLFNFSNTKGILALENVKDKRVLLVRTSDVLVSLARIIKSIKSRNKYYRAMLKDYRKLDIKLLDSDNSRMTFEYWNTHYKTEGYTFYRSYKAVQYSIKIEVDNEYDVLVKLRSKSNYEVILGVFDTIKDAESFVAYVYPTNEVTAIAYALNEKSKNYFTYRYRV